MRQCVASIKDDNGEVHSLEINAASLFAAAYAVIREWGKLAWYSSDAMIEVKSGTQHWRVRAKTVAAWYARKYREDGLRL